MKILTVAWNIVNFENDHFSVPNNGYSVMVHNICEYIGRKTESYLLQGWPSVPERLFEHINIIANDVSKPAEMSTDNVNIWQHQMLSLFEKTITETQYDFVFIHGAGVFCMNCVETCVKRKLPFAVVFHGSMFKESQFAPREVVDLEKKMVLVPDINIITVSHSCSKDFLMAYPFLKDDQITTIVNGVPIVDNLKVNEAREYHFENKKTLVCAGTLNPRKNQLQLLRAVSLLPNSYKREIHVVLCGKDSKRSPYLESVKQEIQRLNLGECVTYIGALSSNDMFKVYCNADGAVLPSISDGFGLVLAEMLQFGKPVIMFSDIGAASEMNSPDATILVKERTDQALSDAIIEWYDKKWDKDKILEYSKLFTMERVAYEYIEYVDNHILKM